MTIDPENGVTLTLDDIQLLAPRYQSALDVIRLSMPDPQPTVVEILQNYWNADLEIIRQRAHDISVAANKATVDAIATATPEELASINQILGLP